MLSDYKGADAIDLLADIFDATITIINDEDVKKYTISPTIDLSEACKVILKKYKKEALEILTRSNKGEINGANIFPKLYTWVYEMTVGDAARNFTRSADKETSDGGHSGSVTENTEANEN